MKNPFADLFFQSDYYKSFFKDALNKNILLLDRDYQSLVEKTTLFMDVVLIIYDTPEEVMTKWINFTALLTDNFFEKISQSISIYVPNPDFEQMNFADQVRFKSINSYIKIELYKFYLGKFEEIASIESLTALVRRERLTTKEAVIAALEKAFEDVSYTNSSKQEFLNLIESKFLGEKHAR